MELEEFIKTTLINIKKGITEANKSLASLEGKTMGLDGQVYFAMESLNRDKKEGFIAFDVAVTIGQESRAVGGGKIKIAVAGVGGEISDLSSQEHISRIKFHILPYHTVC